MQQSSVEWLVERIKKDTNLRLRGFDIDGMAEQAKAMHEQEHENAFFEGAKYFREGQAWTEQGFREISHIVYRETFGKSEQ